jgi:hypothetical protein
VAEVPVAVVPSPKSHVVVPTADQTSSGATAKLTVAPASAVAGIDRLRSCGPALSSASATMREPGSATSRTLPWASTPASGVPVPRSVMSLAGDHAAPGLREAVYTM